MKSILAVVLNLLYLSSNLVFAQSPAVEVKTYDQLIHAIREARAASQARIEKTVDAEKVREAWEIGKLIQEHILLNKERAEYGDEVVKRLAVDLGTSNTELKYMIEFARAYPMSPPAGQLSWSHYRELLSLNNEKERNELAEQARSENWGRDRVREEVRKRQNRIEAPQTLKAKPGNLYTYRIIKAPHGKYKGQLVVDLGFSSYFKPEEDLKLSEKDMVAMKQDGSTFTLLQDPSLGEADLWTYKAHVIEVVDGDTIHASIDLGFGFTMNQTLRLRGLDAAELKSSDGREAKEFIEKLLVTRGYEKDTRGYEKLRKKQTFVTSRTPLETSRNIIIRTTKSDKYDRYLADIWVGKKYVNQELLDKGLAVKASDS